MSKSKTWSNTAPLTIRRDGDGLLHGFLPTAVTLPASHVHPAVRSAADAAAQAATARAELVAELNARGTQRALLQEELVALAKTDRTAAATRLREFDSETEILSASLAPAAHQVERDAWDALAHTMLGTTEEWNAYIREQGLAAVDRLRDATEVYRAALAECHLLEGLLRRIGVEVHPDQTGADMRARFDYSLRKQSVEVLLNGRDLGNEGRIRGAVELADQYAGAFGGTN